MQKKKLLLVGLLLSATLLVLLGLWYRGRNPQTNSKREVRVGVVLPLTGNTARYGKWIRNALELAREEHNANPSRKYEISFVIEDDAGEAGKAVTATQKLITADRVPAIFGTWSSAGVLAMAPIIESHKVVLMADAISPRVRTAGDWVFRCVPDASLSLSTLEQPIKGSAFQRLAIVYLNNDFGKDLSDFMTRIIGQGPPAIVLNEGYTPGTTDFRTLIEKIRSTRPDALFIAGYVEQGTLIRQSKEQGLKVQIFASPSFENEDILLQAGNTADGIIFPSYFDTNSEVNIMREFLTKYRGRYGESAEGFGASSYAGIKILFEAIERSQSVDSNGIRQSLNSMGNFQSVFGPTFIDETGDLRYPIFLKTVTNGVFVKKP